MPATCVMAPVPDVPTDAPFDFAQASSSRRSFAGTAFFDTTRWVVCYQTDRLEILQQIIRERVDGTIDHVSSEVPNADCVPVGNLAQLA